MGDCLTKPFKVDFYFLHSDSQVFYTGWTTVVDFIPVKYFPNKMVAMVRVFYDCVFCLSTTTIHAHLVVIKIIRMI